ncbi:MAG: aldo/keto reductase [Solirubrobacteraceae bacterium]|nr:aldo/keto reductase [Solirubrobacteraceae bacterium]
MSSVSTIPNITLNDGTTIPQLGFGTWQVTGDHTAEIVQEALRVGYRHIDTAQMYGNEAGVGEGIRAAGLAREDVYITSKLNNGFHEPDVADRAMDATLQALGTDHVDLFLIHWPLPTLYGGDFVQTWKALEKFQADGRATSIGVSNFQVDHLERLAAEADVVPAVNQFELHPLLLNEEVHEYGKAHGIVTEAWSPLAQGRIIGNPAIAAVAERHDRTVAQIVLRWHLQRGHVIFPKSITPARISENFQLFDFELDAHDTQVLESLDRGESGRTGPHPDTFAYVPE